VTAPVEDPGGDSGDLGPVVAGAVGAVVARIARRITALQRRVDRAVTWRQGTVTAVQAGPPVTVTVDVGETNPLLNVRCQGWYSAKPPAVNDVVGLLSLGAGRWLCIGTMP
jgi:hypothetical protein